MTPENLRLLKSSTARVTSHNDRARTALRQCVRLLGKAKTFELLKGLLEARTDSRMSLLGRIANELALITLSEFLLDASNEVLEKEQEKKKE